MISYNGNSQVKYPMDLLNKLLDHAHPKVSQKTRLPIGCTVPVQRPKQKPLFTVQWPEKVLGGVHKLPSSRNRSNNGPEVTNILSVSEQTISPCIQSLC